MSTPAEKARPPAPRMTTRSTVSLAAHAPKSSRNSVSNGRLRTFSGGRSRAIQATRSLSCMEIFIRMSEDLLSSTRYPGISAKRGIRDDDYVFKPRAVFLQECHSLTTNVARPRLKPFYEGGSL